MQYPAELVYIIAHVGIFCLHLLKRQVKRSITLFGLIEVKSYERNIRY